MSMESLGGSMPPGGPVTAFAGGQHHVFAVGAGGVMNHWKSANGLDWSGPEVLFGGTTNLAPCFPCAITLDNGQVIVLAIGNGGFGSTGGPLMKWVSNDGGAFFPPPIQEPAWALPGGPNGVAAVSPAPNQLDAFAITAFGIIRYSWNPAGTSLGVGPLPNSDNVPMSALAAVSPAPNVVDLFAVGADGSGLRWHSPAPFHWTRSVLPRPAGMPSGPYVQNGLAAVSPSPGKVELFGVTGDGRLTNWSMDGASVVVTQLPAPPWSVGPGVLVDMTLPQCVPAAVMTGDHLEVFAIGAPPDAFTGGALIRWRRDGQTWSEPVVIRANLAAGRLGALGRPDRVDVFGFNSGTNNSLQHWPAGIAAAGTDPWRNWAGNMQSYPAGHCRPSTLEELVAIVKTAEKVPANRVRAVGSSWSFSSILENPGYVVETHGLNKVIKHVITPNELTPQAPAPRYLVHVEAGIKVNDLMTVLDSRGLAPFTLGGASGQTIAGVVSTSVHGSDWDRGPIPNMVRAIHLVGPGGVQHWIEPDQWRITDANALRARLPSAVQIHYDDDWFDAALVSVGSLGIVYAYVLEATDQHFLVASTKSMGWQELRLLLKSGEVFTPENRFVQVAIDPGEVGNNRKCYLMTRRQAPVGTPSGASDPDVLGAFCQLDFLRAVIMASAGSAVASTVMALIGVVFPPALGIGLVPELVPLLGAALAPQGEGALLNFIGTLLNVHPDLAAATVSGLTSSTIKVGQDYAQDIAHQIMAPLNLGDCAARGLSIELAFDTAFDKHIDFIDEMMGVLDQQRLNGAVLGGWVSMRFVGPSRAILSPQQSARTCMVEVTSIHSLNGTKPIMKALEDLGARHGAVAHWGMFNDFSAARVKAAYPRLDTWKRVRQELSAGGTLRTFDNKFTADSALEGPPAGVPTVVQDDWRCCFNCLNMVHSGGGVCALGGGPHNVAGSGNYRLPHNFFAGPGERKWHWCSKCSALHKEMGGSCPAGGGSQHSETVSGEYTLLKNGEENWRWCRTCQSLALAAGKCPSGGGHDLSGSGKYWLAVADEISLRATKWRLCRECQGLVDDLGKCAGGAAHQRTKMSYFLQHNAPAAPGQAHWRRCIKCASLSYAGGACFAGGTHDHTGSGDYTLVMDPGQRAWRYCKLCQGLWYDGMASKGVCASVGGRHDAGFDEYFVAYS